MNEPRWTVVGVAADWQENSGKQVLVGPRRIGVFRYQSRWYALKDICPHAGVSLARGPLADGTVMCLGHGWRFSLDTGEIETGPGGFSVPTWPVREREGLVEVGV